MEAEYNILMNKKTTEVRERFVDRTVTDYVEKKMRKTTTETPIPAKTWESNSYSTYERTSSPVVKQSYPSRTKVVSPARLSSPAR